MGKAFEKQIKTIDDQGKKQVEALKDIEPKEQTKLIENKSNKIFNRLFEKKAAEIQKTSKEIDFNKLVYYFKAPNIAPINFIRFRGPLQIFNELKNGNTLKKLKKTKKKFKSNLGEIISGDQKYKSDWQSNAIKNIKSLYNSRQRIVD